MGVLCLPGGSRKVGRYYLLKTSSSHGLLERKLQAYVCPEARETKQPRAEQPLAVCCVPGGSRARHVMTATDGLRGNTRCRPLAVVGARPLVVST